MGGVGGGRFSEVGANSRLGAYSNKYGISGGGGVGENDSRGEGEAAPIGKNEFKLRLFMLLTFKLIISTIFMYKLNWRSMSKIFLDLTQWGAKVAIVHKIRE